MSMFGLNFVVTWNDQATAGINRTQSALQNLTVAGFAFTQVGNSMVNAGKKIVGAFGGIFKAFIDTSAKMETLRASFVTTFGELADKKLKWGVEFAADTPFLVEDTTSAMAGLSRVGIDVSKEFENANGQMVPFLQYVGDLSTFNMGPRGGIRGMVTALGNMAADEKIMSLQTRFNIPKRELNKLKDALGKGNEAFMQAFVDLAKNKAPDAMKNMVGTWDQILSNMEDNWTIFIMNVGKTGVFLEFRKTLQMLGNEWAEFVSNGDASKVFSDALKEMAVIAKDLAYWFVRIVKGVTNWLKENPKIAGLIAKFTLLGGIVLIITGTFFKFFGITLLAIASMAQLAISLGIVKLGAEGASISLKGLFSKFLPFAIVGLVVFYLWKYHLEDIKLLITKVQKVWQGFVEVVRDGKLSEETKKALDAEDLTKYVNGLVKLKANFEDFVSGFVKGMDNSRIAAEKFIKALADTLEKMGVDDATIKSLRNLSDVLADADWKAIGEGVAYLVVGLTALLLIGKVAGVILAIGRGLGVLWSAIKLVGSASAGAFRATASFLNLFRFGGPIMTPIGHFIMRLPSYLRAINGAALGARHAVWSFFDAFAFGGRIMTPIGNFLKDLPRLMGLLKEAFKFGGPVFKPIGNFLLNIPKWINNAVVAIKSLKKIFTIIKNTISGVKLAANLLRVAMVSLGLSFPVIGWVLAVLAMLATAWYFRDEIKKAFKIASKAVGTFIEDLPTYKEKYEKGMEELGNAALRGLGFFLRYMELDFADDVVKGFNDLDAKLIVWETELNTTIDGWVKNAGAKGLEFGEAFVKGVVDSNTQMVEWETQMNESIDTWLNDTWTSFVEWVPKFIEDVKKWLDDTWTAFTTWAPEFLMDFGSLLLDIGIAIVMGVPYIIENWDKLWGKIKAFVLKWGPKLKKMMDKAMELLGKAILGAVDLLTKAAKAVGKAIVDAVLEKLGTLGDGVVTIFQGVATIIDGFMSTFSKGYADAQKYRGHIHDQAVMAKQNAPYSFDGSDYNAPRPQPIWGTSGATGGFIKGEGTMYVHPNELLVNDSLTQKLAGFLGGTTNNNQASSVTFSEGSINIMASNSSSQEAKKLAREVIQEIDKQRQLSNIMSYKLPS